MERVAHLTSVHSRHDTRVFHKQCRSLAAAGYEVFLVVADGLGNETLDGVSVVDVGRSRSRLLRMLGATRRVLRAAIRLDARAYHIHDPELIPAGLALRLRGKTVVFDAHEDLPRQILAKAYLRPFLRRILSMGLAIAERLSCAHFSAVIAATPTIRKKFESMGIRAIEVNNYPMLGELVADVSWNDKEREVCYVGGLAASRGIRELVAAMALSRSGARLNLGGEFSESALESDVTRDLGWTRVVAHGHISRSEVRSVFRRSVAGLVTLHPTPAYLDSLPVKMFEYMSAGLPVIASDFPLWREIIVDNDCGLCVDPLDPAAIATAIDFMVENPTTARELGENGRRIVEERYNWAIEERKLLELYRSRLSR